MRVRVCLIDSGKEWGGGTNSMLELLKRIDRERFEVCPVFYRDYRRGEGKLLSEILADHGFSLHVLPSISQPIWAKLGKELARGVFKPFPNLRARSVDAIESAWRILPRAAQLEAFLRAGKFDLVYTNNQPESNREAYLAAASVNLPLVQHCRIEPVLTLESLKLAQTATRMIGVSMGVVESLRAQGVRSDILVNVNNGIDIAQTLPDGALMRERYGYLPEQKIAVTLGQLIPRKGILDILMALVHLPDWLLAIVGEGPQKEELMRIAERLNLTQRVRFVGFSQTPLEWLALADVFILASRSEGLPRVCLEAMLSKKPILGSDIAGTRDVMKDGETGFLFPYGSVARLIEVWKLLDSDAARAKQMGEAGYARVCQHFSIERYVKETQEVLWKAAGR